MSEDWENLTYTRNWIKELKKKPDWVSFGLKRNEQNQTDKMFEIALQPPFCYPAGNSANRIPLNLDHARYVRDLNSTWLTYCDMGYKLDQEIKAKGLDFEPEREIRKGLTKIEPIDKKSIQTKIAILADHWHK